LKQDGSIVGWGSDGDGQATPPPGNDYVAIAANWRYSLALKQDGSIVGWGDNDYGQARPPRGNDYVAIAAGWRHALALKEDGSIVGWGHWKYDKDLPPEGNDYVAIAAGYDHSLALKEDGSIVGWGKNDCGESTPPAGNNYVAIAAGEDYSLAIVGGEPNLVAWWKFDEGAGNIAHDSSGNGYHGIVYGDPQWRDGHLVLDGIDDYVELPIGSLISSLNECTITARVNWSAQGDTWQRIFDFGTDTTNYICLTPNTPSTGVMLELPPAGEVMAPISWDGPTQVSITVGTELRTDLNARTATLGGWQHVAVVLKPDDLQLYRYGQLESSVFPSCVLSDLGETTNNWLGRSQYPEHPYFNGALDDVRIYDVALTAEEIAALSQ
jgi:hypothetical protein